MFWESETFQRTTYENNCSRMSDGGNIYYDALGENHNSFENKENVLFPAEDTEDLTLYGSNSPSRMSCDDGSPRFTLHIRRTPAVTTMSSHASSLVDLDSTSQDSGYSMSETITSPRAGGGRGGASSFGSLCSMEDELLLDLSELDSQPPPPLANSESLHFRKLINGSLLLMKSSPETQHHHHDVVGTPQRRRAMSTISNNTTPRRVRSCLFSAVTTTPEKPMVESFKPSSFKRPEPPTEIASPNSAKKCRLSPQVPTAKGMIARVPAVSILKRFVSADSAGEHIKSVLQRSTCEPDLIGDFSRSFCLPLIAGQHQDLKSIAAETLANLIHGQYKDTVASYKVIDCRYPYEYEGGHVHGSINYYNQDQVLENLLNVKINEGTTMTMDGQQHKRNILVFHCEFSKERGPNLSRFLRNIDRSFNTDSYPSLHYPEIYLLDGGYRNFYEQYAELCTPNGYLSMLHPDHSANFRQFRAKSKTWNVDCRAKKFSRSISLKRL